MKVVRDYPDISVNPCTLGERFRVFDVFFNAMKFNKRMCLYLGISLFMLMSVRIFLMNSDIIQYNNYVFRISEGHHAFVRNKNCVDNFKETIPKIIHQTWNTEIVPSEFVESIRSLVRDNPYPEWQYFWWTKDSMIQLVHDKYPHLLPHVNSSDTPAILRSDIMRYVLMHEFGGAYFDLDTKSVRSLNSFVETHDCSLAVEPGEHYFVHKTDFLITNSVMLCEPRHPFFREMLELVRRNPGCKEAFICTGPPVITRAYLDMKEKSCQACKLPEVQPAEVFQDWYDARYQTMFVEANCYSYSKLKYYQIQICENWKKRGRASRKLSRHAYTYHTWYHIGGRNITLDDKNHILNIIPTAKMYGKDFLSTSNNKSYYFI